MDSGPNSPAAARNRVATVSSASSQLMRSNAGVGLPFLSSAGPFGATRLRGCNTRSGEYTRSRYFATFAQRNPWVIGCEGSPWIPVHRFLFPRLLHQTLQPAPLFCPPFFHSCKPPLRVQLGKRSPSPLT